MLRPALAAGAVTLLLAGCGGSHDRTVTVPAYGEHPSTTIAAGAADPRACRIDARAFANGAVLYLQHSGPKAAYPADLYYVILREALGDFQAHECDPALLGAALRARLTPAQLKAFADDLPATMAAAVRDALG